MESEEIIEDIEAEDEEEKLRRLRRRERIEEMKRQKEKTLMIHRCVLGAACGVLLLAAIGIGGLICSAVRGNPEKPGEENLQTAEAGRENTDTQEDRQETQTLQSPQGQQEAQEIQETQQGQGTEEALRKGTQALQADTTEVIAALPMETEPPEEESIPVFSAHSTDATAGFGDDVVSQYGILIDVEEGAIVACKNPNERMNPASMTKILTVLTAADLLGVKDEEAEVLDDSFTMTIDITDYSYVNECSIVGFEVGETATVRDLFYGTILPSGADAAVGLAVYAAGSHETFVEKMNEKLEQLGLSDTTHFTNCVGLYDEDHYSTVYDMAVILKAAVDNPFCRQVLSSHVYTTTCTEQHPEGLTISNWFLRRIEDKDTHGEVLCGKTGYVDKSGSCAASLAADIHGREYLCVTAGSTTSWRCINDQTDLFQTFLPAE